MSPGPWFYADLPVFRLEQPGVTLTGSVECPVYRTFSLTLTLSNPTSVEMDGVFELRLPPELSVVDFPSPVVTHAGRVQLPVVSAVPKGKKAFLDIRLKASAPGTYSVAVEGTFGGTPIVPVTQCIQITRPRLELTVVPPAHPCPKTVSTWEFAVKNTGDAPAHAALLTWDIPTGVRFLAAPQGNYAAGRVSCNLGSIVPGEEKNVMIRVSSPRPVEISGQAEVSAVGVEVVSRDTVASCLDRPVLDVSLFPRMAKPGIWILEVYNSGSRQALNVAASCEFINHIQAEMVRGVTQGKISETGITFGVLPRIPAGTKVRWELHFSPESSPELEANCTASNLSPQR